MKNNNDWVNFENPFEAYYRPGEWVGYGASAHVEYNVEVKAKVIAQNKDRYKIIISEPVKTKKAGDIMRVKKTSVRIPKDYTDLYVDAYWQK